MTSPAEEPTNKIAQTGEDWIVAFVENGHLYWLGWSPGRAAIAKATGGA